jgi:hypothetical protein
MAFLDDLAASVVQNMNGLLEPPDCDAQSGECHGYSCNAFPCTNFTCYDSHACTPNHYCSNFRCVTTVVCGDYPAFTCDPISCFKLGPC